MAKKASSTSKKRGIPKAVIVLAIIMLVFALAAGLFIYLKGALFSSNNRLYVSEIVITGNDPYDGYWNPRSTSDYRARVNELEHYVMTAASPAQSPVNIFSFDLAVLRKDILASNPEIQFLSISRELPDRLLFTITERIPRAIIGGTDFLLDDDGIVMRRAKTQNIASSLPWIMIRGAAHLPILPGDDVSLKPETVKFAFAFKILSQFRDWSDFRINKITFVEDARSPRIECAVTYGLPSTGETEFILWFDPNLTEDALRYDLPRRIRPMLEVRMTTKNNKAPVDLRFDKSGI